MKKTPKKQNASNLGLVVWASFWWPSWLYPFLLRADSPIGAYALPQRWPSSRVRKPLAHNLLGFAVLFYDFFGSWCIISQVQMLFGGG